MKVSIACDPFAIVRPLIDDRVTIPGYELCFASAMSNGQRHGRMVRDLAFDICELNLFTYMIARSRGVPIIALPVFPYRKFRHGSIYVRRDGRVRAATDLQGARIACPTYQAASGIWIIGILSDSIGFRCRDAQWLTERDETIDFKKPDDLSIRVQQGASGLDLLRNGQADALFTPQTPVYPQEGLPDIRRLFDNHEDADRAYFGQSGIFPIMHVIVMRQELVDAHPHLPALLHQAFDQAKALAYADVLRDRTTLLAWHAENWETQKRLLGPDPWAHGLDAANRGNLEAAARYAALAGIVPAAPSIDDLFYKA